MLNDSLPPTPAEEYRNTAEILRELAAQLRFEDTRDLLGKLAEDLDWRAVRVEGQIAIERPLDSQSATSLSHR